MPPEPAHRGLTWWWDRFPRLRKVVLVAVVCPMLMVLSATVAYADETTAPSSLAWMEIKDTHGVSIWKYELSLDRGGVTDTGKFVWSIATEWMWNLYRAFVAIAIWLIDWVLSFSWLDTIGGPVMSLGENLTVIVDRFGLTTVLLTITAMVAVTWMMRGRWVLGIFELFLSLLIASLAIGALANPVGLVAGKDGMLIKSRDFGLALSAGLVNDGDTSGSPAELRGEVVATLADTFIRQPTQLINFGEVVDGGKCEKTYDEIVEAGPYGDDDDLRDAMGDCEDRMGEVAENPNAGMAVSSGVIFPAAFIVLLFAIVLAGTVLVASVQALYRGLKLIVDLVLALLPGSARGGLWMSVADLVMALVTVVFATVFLAGYLLLIQSVFADGGTARMQTFFAVDVLLVVGIVVFWRGRGRIKDATERLAQTLAKRPAAGPSSLPARSKFNPAEAYYKGRIALGAARIARTGVSALGSGGVALAVGAAGAAATAGRAAARPVTDSAARIQWAAGVASSSQHHPTDRPAETSPLPERTPAERVQHRIGASTRPAGRGGQLVRLGTGAALVAAGAPAAAPETRSGAKGGAGVGSTAVATRRAALAQRMRPAGEVTVEQVIRPGSGTRPGAGPAVFAAARAALAQRKHPAGEILAAQATRLGPSGPRSGTGTGAGAGGTGVAVPAARRAALAQPTRPVSEIPAAQATGTSSPPRTGPGGTSRRGGTPRALLAQATSSGSNADYERVESNGAIALVPRQSTPTGSPAPTNRPSNQPPSNADQSAAAARLRARLLARRTIALPGPSSTPTDGT